MTVFIQKGDAPMTHAQAVTRGLRHFEAEKAFWEREQGIVTSDPEYLEFAAKWVQDNITNAENNRFNALLARYRAALSRLAQYPLAEGRAEVTEEQETGEFDEQGQPITETFIVVPAVEPLVAEPVEYPVFDDETGEEIGTVTEPDREVTARLERDVAERAAAQAVVDSTPQEVKDFHSAALQD